MATKLSGLEFFRDSFFAEEDKQAILDSLQTAVEMDSDRLFVQLGVKNARSTVGLIMALNELGADCNLIAIDSHSSARFAWDSLCSGIRGSCRSQFHSSLSKAIAMDFSYYGPVWILISGCPCHRCVKAHLKDWAHRVILDGFLLMHHANETIEGSKLPSPYHLDVGTEVRCGVLRAIESTAKVVDCCDLWHYTVGGSTKIWRKRS